MSNFIGCDAEYHKSDIVIFGAGTDGTTSYRPGARFAPAVIRAESYGIETYSPYQERDMSEIRVHDAGDLELPFGNTARVLDMIEAEASRILADGKLPCMLGGEHLATLGSVRAAAKRFGELALVHFDAHCDLRDDYLGERLSHATVIRRCHDILGDGRIFQFGIRSGEKEEFAFARAHTLLEPFRLDGIGAVCQKLGARPIYLTIDMDVLDPSVFPGTGTPEPGGVSFEELLAALRELSALKLNVVACDLVELSPPYDPSGISAAVACKLLRELLLGLGR